MAASRMGLVPAILICLVACGAPAASVSSFDFLSSPVLAGDINTQIRGEAMLTTEFVRFNGLVYFPSSDESYGTELFYTDGSGAQLVVDASPGLWSSSPRFLTVFANRLFWVANQTQLLSLGIDNQIIVHSPLAVAVRTGPTSPFVISGSKMFFPVFTTSAGSELGYIQASDPSGAIQVIDICAAETPAAFGVNIMVTLPCSSRAAILTSNPSGGVLVHACMSWGSVPPSDLMCTNFSIVFVADDASIIAHDWAQDSPVPAPYWSCSFASYSAGLVGFGNTAGQYYYQIYDSPFVCQAWFNGTAVEVSQIPFTPYSLLAPNLADLQLLLEPFPNGTSRTSATALLPLPSQPLAAANQDRVVMLSSYSSDTNTTNYVFVFDTTTGNFSLATELCDGCAVVQATARIPDVPVLTMMIQSMLPPSISMLSLDVNSLEVQPVLQNGMPFACLCCEVTALNSTLFLQTTSSRAPLNCNSRQAPVLLDQSKSGSEIPFFYQPDESVISASRAFYLPVSPSSQPASSPLDFAFWSTGITSVLGVQVFSFQDPRTDLTAGSTLNYTAARVTSGGIWTTGADPVMFAELDRQLLYVTTRSTRPEGFGATPLDHAAFTQQLWATDSTSAPSLLLALNSSIQQFSALYPLAAGNTSQGALADVGFFSEHEVLLYVDAATAEVTELDLLEVVNTTFSPLLVTSYLPFGAPGAVSTAFVTFLSRPEGYSPQPLPAPLPQSMMLMTSLQSTDDGIVTSTTSPITDLPFQSTFNPDITTIPAAIPACTFVVEVGTYDGFTLPRANTGKTLIISSAMLSVSNGIVIVSDGNSRWVAAEFELPASPLATLSLLQPIPGSPFALLTYGNSNTTIFAAVDLSETRPDAPAASVQPLLTLPGWAMAFGLGAPVWWTGRGNNAVPIAGDVVAFRAGLGSPTFVPTELYLARPTIANSAVVISPIPVVPGFTLQLTPVVVLPAYGSSPSRLIASGFAVAMNSTIDPALLPSYNFWSVDATGSWHLTTTVQDSSYDPPQELSLSVSAPQQVKLVPQPNGKSPIAYIVSIVDNCRIALIAFNGTRAVVASTGAGESLLVSSLGGMITRGERTPVMFIDATSILYGSEVFWFFPSAPLSPVLQPPVVTPINVTIVVVPPTPNSKPSSSSQDPETFGISLGNWREVAPDGTIVATATVDESSFNVTSFALPNDYSNFNYTGGKMSNGADLSVYYWFFVYGRTIDFAGEQLEFGDQSLKFSYQVRSWPFQSTSNRLEVSIDVVALDDSTKLCGKPQSSTSDGALAVQLQTASGLVVSASLTLVGLVDNRTVDIVAEVQDVSSAGRVGAALVVSTPSFLDSVIVDPELSFADLLTVQDTQPDYQEQKCGGSNGLSAGEIALAVVIPVVVCGCCLFVVLASLAYLATRTKPLRPYFRRHSSKGTSVRKKGTDWYRD